MSHIILVILASLLMIPGIITSIFMPGTLYMFVIALVFGYIDQFAHLTPGEVGILAAITGIALIVDFLAGIIGAKSGGAHWTSIVWGLVGFIIGSAIIPIPVVGSLVGMFLGVLGSEWYRTKDGRQAKKAATGTFLGWVAGTGFKIGAALVFLALFIVCAIS